jgi:DNA polymerase III delta subunit
MKHWDQIPEENILILVSYKPDKRTKSRKFFSSKATIKEFKKKKGKDLTLFVLDKCSVGE